MATDYSRDAILALRAIATDFPDGDRRIIDAWAEVCRRNGWGFAVVDAERGTFLFVSRAYAASHGYEPEELFGAEVPTVYAPEERGAVPSYMRAARENGNQTFEAVHLRKDGTRFPVRVDVIPLAGEDGVCRLFAASVQDISREKAVEEALRQSEQRLRLQFERVPMPTFTWQRRGEEFVLVDYNAAADKMTGGRVERLLGRTASDLYQDDPAILQDFAHCYDQQTAIQREMDYRLRSTGEEKRLKVTYAFIPPDLIRVHTEDITERRRAEDELRHSEERFRLLAEHAQDMIFRYRVTEPRGFEYVSPAVTKLTGYTPEQYYANPNFAVNVIHPNDRETFGEMIRNRVTKPVELRWLRSDGSVVWTEQRNTYVYDDDGNLVAVEGIVRDISERKEVALALRRAREELEGRVERQMERKNPYGLTFRELTVLNLIVAGKADKEIAAELAISPLTAHKHVANILAKMSATSRTEAGVRALREGLIV